MDQDAPLAAARPVDRLRSAWREGRVPRWIKVSWLLWMLVWIPAYSRHYGPANFLWFCDTANFFLLVAIWWESAYLFSALAAGVLIIQIVWCADFFGASILGQHLIGGTEYMFDATIPLAVRSMSLFHLVVPPLLIWALMRLGYHRSGWRFQAVVFWVLLVPSFLLGPELNLNWVWQPFGMERPQMPLLAWFVVCAVTYPLVILGISHPLLCRLFAPPRG
jgi:hypothetical protein